MNVWVNQADVIEVLQDLGIDTDAWEASSYEKLNKAILRTQREFERLTRRKFERDTILEKLHGTGTETIVLRGFPIVSITSIIIKDAPGYQYAINLAEYRIDEDTGVVTLVSTQPYLISIFPLGKLNIEATYTFGYLFSAIPEDIQDVIRIMTVVRVIMRTPADWEKLGLRGIRIAQYAEQYGSTSGKQGKSSSLSGIYGPQKEAWSMQVASTIARYKRIPIH